MHTSFLSTLASAAKPWQRWGCCAAHIVAIDQCTMQDVGLLRALSKARAVHLPRHGALASATLAITILRSIERPKRLKPSRSSYLCPVLPPSEPENFPFRQVLWGKVFRLSQPDAPIAFPKSATERFDDSNETTKRSRWHHRYLHLLGVGDDLDGTVTTRNPTCIRNKCAPKRLQNSSLPRSE